MPCHTALPLLHHVLTAALGQRKLDLSAMGMSYFAFLYAQSAPSLSTAQHAPSLAEALDAAPAQSHGTSATPITLADHLPTRVRKRRRLIEQVPRKFSRNTISDFVSLIKTIPPDLHPRIERYIVRVFNGTADREGLIRFLHEKGGVSEARARMIADDQIAKAAERMRVEKWRSHGKDYVRWVHAGASDPRDYHLRDWDGISGADGRPNGLNGFVFELSNPPVIDLVTGERGYPAQLVNCHCYLEPISVREFDALAGQAAAAAAQEYLDSVLLERGNLPLLTA